MHESAFNKIKKILEPILSKQKNLKVLDLGARSESPDLSIKSLVKSYGCEHVGLDLVLGNDVDDVLREPYGLPYKNEEYDVVICAHALQNIPFFWITAMEMTRVLKPEGMMIIAVASRGHENRTPYDCYRFYPDFISTIAAWCQLSVTKLYAPAMPKQSKGPRIDYAKISSDIYWGEVVGGLKKSSGSLMSVLGLQVEVMKDWANANAKIQDFFRVDQNVDADSFDEVIQLKNSQIKFPVISGIITDLVYRNLSQGRYERDESALAIKYLSKKPGHRILELGAGLGFMSTLLSTELEDITMLSIEADPRLIDYIKLVHRINGVSNVIVNNCIATQSESDLKRGYVEFTVRPNFWGSSTKHKPEAGIRTLRIRTESFQNYIDLFKPTVLIIDIEGGETDIFTDLRIEPVEYIIIELHPKMIGHEGVDKVVKLIEKNGLKIHESRQGGEVVIFSREED